MSWRFNCLVATILLLASGYSSAQNPTLRTAMREKLDNSRGLFEAVVTADYPAIARSASALSRISETEIASWQVGAAPEYTKQGVAFVSAVRDLREAAVNRDIDAALAGYTALVSSCTRCHALVRRGRAVRIDAPHTRQAAS